MGREGLEAALAAGAFEQNMAILFLSDAIWQLLSTQQPATSDSKNASSYQTSSPQKSHLKMASALPLFGIDQIYTSQEDLNDLSLELDELALSPTALCRSDIAALMSHAKTILSF